MSKEKMTIAAPVRGDYNGNPTLSIPLASGKPFTFGVEKAAAILKHLEEIKKFSAEHPPKKADLAKAVSGMSAEEKAELAALLAASK